MPWPNIDPGANIRKAVALNKVTGAVMNFLTEYSVVRILIFGSRMRLVHRGGMLQPFCR